MAAPEEVRGKILLAAQEITFAKVLAGNDKPTRDRGVKRLRKWLTARSEGTLEFSEEDHLTLWKGLFYCMWMSDKPLVQEDLAEQISNLIHCFKKSHQGILFMKCFFQTMAREWFGIDQFRLDKFMMLVRRCVRQLFMFCSNLGWTPKSCEEVCNLFESVLINSSNNAIGLVLHISDIILEELAKAGGGENVILYVIKPWAKLIGMHHDRRIRQHVVDRVFHHLIKQSNLGIEYQDKFDAWKEAGFPGNSWREMEAVEVDDGENEDVIAESSKNEKILDPRAGKVDVELPQIMFEPEEVSNILHEEQSRALLLRGRKALCLLSSQFKQLADGHYPLEFKKPPGSEQRLSKRKAAEELWDAAEDLLEYESEAILNEKQHRGGGEKDELVQPTKKMKLENITVEGFLSKSKKKKLRLKQAKQKWNMTNISDKVKTSVTNQGNSENLLIANGITKKITPAKKHQQHILCDTQILSSMQADSSDKDKPVDSMALLVKKKKQSLRKGKSPKLNVVTPKINKKSPLKEMTSSNEIKLVSSSSPKQKKNKIHTGIESSIINAASIHPQLQGSDKICDSIQADAYNEEQEPIVQLKKKRKSLEDRKSPKHNVRMPKKSKKSPLKGMTLNNEIKLIASPSPKRKYNEVSTGTESGILNAGSVSPQLQESDFNFASTEGNIVDSIQTDTRNEEHKPIVQLKKKRQSLEDRKSPKQNGEMQKKTEKSPLNNEIKLVASPSPKRKNNIVSTGTESGILSTDSVIAQLQESDFNSTSTEGKILDLIQTDICNEENTIKLLKNKRQSLEDRKSPKQNVENPKKSKKSPLKEATSNNDIKLTGSPSPTRKYNTINTDRKCDLLSSDSTCSQLQDSNSSFNFIVTENIEMVNDDMCTTMTTPIKHKNGPVLIKEPMNEGSLRRSLRIRTPIKTNIEQTPIGRPVKSKSSLSTAKGRKQRLSECQSETSFVGSQVGAVLVQKFESDADEGIKQTRRSSINRRASLCDRRQISSVSEPQSCEKTPVTNKVTKIKTRKTPINSTPQQNTSLQTEGSGKKVNIVLKKNMSQGFMEYEQAVKNSPDIPFDASKKPIQGVLKPTSVPSPLNPFYKLKKIKF